MYNKDLVFNIDKILSFDEITIAKDTIQQDGEIFYSLEINDHTFLYASVTARNQDHNDILSLINNKVSEVDNLISNELLYSAMMAINIAPNTEMYAFKDTYDVGAKIKEHLIRIGFLDANKIKNFNF